MSAKKSTLLNPVTLFAQIEDAQYRAIRGIAIIEKKNISEVVRECLACYLKEKLGDRTVSEVSLGDIEVHEIRGSIFSEEGGIVEESLKDS